uniref:Uncharacterized protein n=1 Tax=Megaselia scalaris TaxID=36166 RepID=T1GK30_MEGSC
MAEGKPPYGDIHPMRAIFMIPQKPPPSFRHPDDWSTEFIDFVMLCLVKNPEERATATELLSHEYIQNAKPRSILKQIIEEACEAREAQRVGKTQGFIQAKCPDSSPLDGEKDDEQLMSGTIKEFPEDQGTLIPEKFNINNNQQEPSAPDYGTLVPDSGTMIEIESNLGTMVINSDGEDATLKAGMKTQVEMGMPTPKYTHTKFVDEDFDKLKFLSFDELKEKLSLIDREMERDIEELTNKYNSKRKPILDAITAKRKRQNNINSNLIKI